MSTNTAMILGAGFGKRLYPITRNTPKPLLPIFNQPLLIKIITNLSDAGIKNICINTHHLSKKISDFVQKNKFDSSITLFHEPKILGTGGGLLNARKILEKQDFFILHNGDILSDVDVQELMDAHAKSDAIATLLLIESEKHPNVLVSRKNIIRNFRHELDITPNLTDKCLTYGGIAAISREIFDYLEAGYFDLIDGLLNAIQDDPTSINAYIPSEIYWNDIGTVGKYLQAHREFSEKNRVQISQNAKIGEAIDFSGFISIGENVRIGNGVSLKNCVILPNAQIKKNKDYENAVIGEDFIITKGQNDAVLKEIVQKRFSYNAMAQSLVERGSDRIFWRITEADETAVLMESTGKDADFESHIVIGKFLSENDLGAPEIFDYNEKAQTILMEDLGDDTLYKLAHQSPESRRELYQKTLDLLVDLQIKGTAFWEQSDLKPTRIFDYDTFRWETRYFRENFLERYLGLKIERNQSLTEEFHRLATEALNQPIVLIHRDFQSQNIFLADGKIRIIDVQGARLGSICYDLMSLLRDAYVDLGEELREELLEYYRKKLIESGGFRFGEEELKYMSIIAGLQRNMQALGAFSYLSLTKGKKQFEQYIPLGLKHLKEGLMKLKAFRHKFEPLTHLEEIVIERGGS